MKITCPGCGFEGNVKDDLIPDSGRNIGCPKCKKKFFIEKETAFILEDVDEKASSDATPKRPPSVVTPIKNGIGGRSTEGGSFWNKNRKWLIPVLIVFFVSMIPIFMVGSCIISCLSTEDSNKKAVEKVQPKQPQNEKGKDDSTVAKKDYVIINILLKDGTEIECIKYKEVNEMFYFTDTDGIDGFVKKKLVSKIVKSDKVVYDSRIAKIDLAGTPYSELDTKDFVQYFPSEKDDFLNSDKYKNKKCIAFGKVTKIGENDSPNIYGTVTTVVRIVTYGYIYVSIGTNEDVSNLRVGDKIKAYGFYLSSYKTDEFEMSYATIKLYDKEYMGYSKNLWDVER